MRSRPPTAADPAFGMVEPGTRRQDSEVDAAALRALLADVVSGALSADEAVTRLRRLPFADLGFARVDHHRALRQGLPEAVYAPGKTPEQVAAIVASTPRPTKPRRWSGLFCALVALQEGYSLARRVARPLWM